MSGSDSTVMVAGQLLDIVDDEWRADTLPFDGESPSRYHETHPDLTLHPSASLPSVRPTSHRADPRPSRPKPAEVPLPPGVTPPTDDVDDNNDTVGKPQPEKWNELALGSLANA